MAAKPRDVWLRINAARQVPVRREEMELMTWALYQYGEKTACRRLRSCLAVVGSAAEKWKKSFSTYDLFLTPDDGLSSPFD